VSFLGALVSPRPGERCRLDAPEVVMFAVDPESVIRRAVMNLANRFEVTNGHKKCLNNGH
jgi:hypothetical protein